MKSRFLSVIQAAIKEEGAKLDDTKKADFENYVGDIEEELDNMAEHIVTKIKDEVDKLEEKFQVDVKDQRDHIISGVFGNFPRN